MILEKYYAGYTSSPEALSGDGLVGGNPTMNTPRLRRGGGVASSSFVFYLLYVLVFLYINSIFCL